MKFCWWLGCVLAVHVAWAGDFKADYYAGTEQGSWAQLQLTAKDGTVALYTYERKPDADGQAVLELEVKTTGGAAAGSESTMLYTMPKGFDLARLGMSYGKFIEKMVMKYGEMEMPVDDATLEVIRQAEKDYRGKVTFTGTETIGTVPCDRYTYDIKTDAYRETGTLWLSDTIPFALVRQKGQVVNADGTPDPDFEMILQEHGRLELASEEPAAEPVPEPPAQPITTTLAEGFKAGRIGLDVEALAGGRQLKVNFRNEYDAQITLELAAGPVDLEVGFPAETLRLTIPKPARLVLEARTTSDPLVVAQRGPRGIAEGKCYLSAYEGTPIFQGSVTMDQVPK